MQRTPSRRLQSRRFDRLLIIFGALTVAAVIAALIWDSRPSQSATEPRTPPTIELPSDDRKVALFIGDSYTAGVGAEGKQYRWTALLSQDMDWIEVNKGLGGTGYVSVSGRNGCGQETCSSYPDRFSMVDDDVRADVVVVAGGQNDFAEFQEEPATVTTVIRDFYAQVAEAYPDARIIAVGPSSPQQISGTATEMAAAVSEASSAVGAEYVSLTSPPVISSEMVLDDNAHVDRQGHEAIAERVAMSLR